MNFNPFDLRGPEFLLFYAVLSGITVLVVWLLRRAKEGGEAGSEIGGAREIAEDPYQVAFLRGGRYEVLNVALISLIERGLLKANGEYLLTTSSDAVENARRPLDKAILTRFTSKSLAEQGRNADLVYRDTAILAEADHIGEALQRRKLLPDDEIKESRKQRIIAAVAFLWVVAGVKIFIALSRGRTNILFLIGMAILVPFLLLLVSRRFRTVLGDRTYKWIQSLFSNLRSRRDSFGINNTSSELTFLAAAFGLGALPAAVGGIIEPLHLKPPRPEGTGGGGCGSSCASFSSCGGSGGCGGGGCGGGGCGGCGG